MLERDTARQRGLQAQSRAGWYVAGTVCAVFLVGLLVWLARESPKVQQMEAVLAAADTGHPTTARAGLDSGVADEAPSMAHAPMPSAAALPSGRSGAAERHAGPDLAGPATDGAAATEAGAGVAFSNRAAIVDEQAAASRTQDSQQHLPPIELAKPGLFGPVPGTQSTTSVGPVVRDEAIHTPTRPAVTASNPDAAPSPGAASGHSNSRAQSGNRSKPRKLAQAGAKAKRASTRGAQAGNTQADSDVALISAVIQHGAHRPGTACAEGDAECAAKATPTP